MSDQPISPALPPIYIVSGGIGASAEQLVRTALAQFPESLVPVITVGHVRHLEQIEHTVTQAATAGGTIVHTLVESPLRGALVQLAQQQGVAAIDLMGPLLSRLTETLGQDPIGHPGLYRQLHQLYFERVTAIEFSLAHDDGQRSEDWPLAQIVLAGVSRVGKTPLSVYLSVLGWKVANAPLVLGVTPPSDLLQLDRQRVIGLTIEPGQLLVHRQRRQRRLGAPGPSAYTNPDAVLEELEAAREMFRRGGFSVIDVTDKPIETSTEEIIELITRRTQTDE